LLLHFQGGTSNIDWSKPIDWNDNRLEDLMIAPGERISGRKEIDPGKISYSFDFFGEKEIVSIYPDTLVWIRDFTYASNEPWAQKYFSNSFYDHYPVVGISLKQAMAFCQWKTEQITQALKGEAADSLKMVVRLPSGAEWESAAVEEKDTAGLFSGSQQYNCNFGTMTDREGATMKGLKDDGYFFTAPIKSFPPGLNGLYDMKGNVAEWTSTTREEIMKADVKPEKLKTSFVAKGGGWNSTPFYLQPGVCQFFSVDDTHSFVGFRYVVYVFKK
jgi:formylglycine-generating enzyme required for sulfatase activity